MAEGRSNQAIAAMLHVNDKTVESHISSIFTKLTLLPAPDDHRRVLAVLTWVQQPDSRRLEANPDPRSRVGTDAR